MRGRYRALFLIPAGSSRRLTAEGWWEFESSERIPQAFVDALVEAFDATFKEEFLGTRVHSAERLEISAAYDATGEIEVVQIKDYGDPRPIAPQILQIIDEQQARVTLFDPLSAS
ncbi:hypothetical protein AB4059_04675 [Lysobacter sp. 2RAF19]